jgi:hypothetical protein
MSDSTSTGHFKVKFKKVQETEDQITWALKEFLDEKQKSIKKNEQTTIALKKLVDEAKREECKRLAEAKRDEYVFVCRVTFCDIA